MGAASPAAKDERPGTGLFSPSGPHQNCTAIVAEVPPLTRKQVEAWMHPPKAMADPVSILFGLAIGMIIGFAIRDSFDRK